MPTASVLTIGLCFAIAMPAAAQSPDADRPEDRTGAPPIEVRGFEQVDVAYTVQPGPGWRLGKAFADIDETMSENNQSGPTFARYVKETSSSPQERLVEVGFFIRGYVPHDPRFKRKTLPACEAVTMTVRASYGTASLYHQTLFDWAANHGYRSNDALIEVYPSRSPDDPVIELRLPVERAAFARRTPATNPVNDDASRRRPDTTPHVSEAIPKPRTNASIVPHERTSRYTPPPTTQRDEPSRSARGLERPTHAPIERDDSASTTTSPARGTWSSRDNTTTTPRPPRPDVTPRRSVVIPPPTGDSRRFARATPPVTSPKTSPSESFDPISYSIDDAEWFSRIADRLKVIRDVVKMKYGAGEGGVEALVAPILERAAEAAKAARMSRTIGGSSVSRETTRRKTELLRELDKVMVSAHIREYSADKVRSELLRLLILARNIGTVSDETIRVPSAGRIIGG